MIDDEKLKARLVESLADKVVDKATKLSNIAKIAKTPKQLFGAIALVVSGYDIDKADETRAERRERTEQEARELAEARKK